MSELFKNYGKQKIIPHNRFKKLDVEKEFWDTIYVGANAYHNFQVPRKKAMIENLVIYYRQGTEVKVIKEMSDVTIIDLPFMEGYPSYVDGCSMVKYSITKEDSLNFNRWNTEVYAQIKVFLTDGRIEYSPEYKVQICDSLMRNEPLLRTTEADTTIVVEELEG